MFPEPSQRTLGISTRSPGKRVWTSLAPTWQLAVQQRNQLQNIIRRGTFTTQAKLLAAGCTASTDFDPCNASRSASGIVSSKPPAGGSAEAAEEPPLSSVIVERAPSRGSSHFDFLGHSWIPCSGEKHKAHTCRPFGQGSRVHPQGRFLEKQMRFLSGV